MRLKSCLIGLLTRIMGPLIIAQEKGYFAEAGLDVEIIAPADPSAPPKLVAAGQADLARQLPATASLAGQAKVCRWHVWARWWQRR